MKIVRETAKAYLLQDTGGRFWVPKVLYQDNKLAPFHKKVYLREQPIEEIAGEDIDFSKPTPPTNGEFIERAYEEGTLFEVSPSDIDEYQEDVRAGYEGTYAQWCSKDLPF